MKNRTEAPVEKTMSGWQYVLPGAERKMSIAAERPAYQVDGDQFVIPAAEAITTRQLLRRKLAAPIRPRRGQKSVRGTALFDAWP